MCKCQIGLIAVENRSHNQTTADMNLQSFFYDQTGRSAASGCAEFVVDDATIRKMIIFHSKEKK